ncbi:Hsp70 family protein [Alphaproteobacteria bacterium]|nr:Hsp70 family protein [Alphaproteobacteria bacterium]
MGSYIGIDLGTTFCAISVLDDTGRPTIVNIPDKKIAPEGNIISSCVLFQKDKAIIGDPARRAFQLHRKAFGRFKRDMGTSKTYELDGKEITPFDLSTIVLSELKKIAEEQLGEIEKAVITIPANFTNEARDQTLNAAKKAGLNVDHIVNEPTAAALFYAFDNRVELHGNYVIYDLGGGTFDVSVINVNNQNIEVLASGGINKLGGDDFDKELINLIKEKFKKDSGKDPELDENGSWDLYNLSVAEADKKSLSKRGKCIAGGDDGIGDEILEIKRTDFEKNISSLLAQTEMLCESTLAEAGLEVSEIEEIILVGGSTRIPAVKSSIKRVFKKEPVTAGNVDEMVALGAALYSAIKSDKKGLNSMQKASLKPLNVTDIANHYFGTIARVYNENKKENELQNVIIINKNTKLPVTKSEEMETLYDDQDVIEISVTQSSTPDEDPDFVKTIWEGEMKLPPGRPKGQPLTFTYSYDENQIMHCIFEDINSNKKVEVELKPEDHKNENSAIDKFLVD